MRRRRGSAHLVNRVVGYDRKTGEHVLEGEGGAKNRVRLHERRYFVLGHKVPMRYLLIWDAAAFTVAAIGALLYARAVGAPRTSLRGAKVAYSISAFPFFMISLPPYVSPRKR